MFVSSLQCEGESIKRALLCRYNSRGTDLWVEWELQFTTACQKRESRSLYNSWRYRTPVHSTSYVLEKLVWGAFRLLDLTYCPFKSEFYCDDIVLDKLQTETILATMSYILNRKAAIDKMSLLQWAYTPPWKPSRLSESPSLISLLLQSLSAQDR